MPQRIIKCADLKSDLSSVLQQITYDKLFVLTDNTTENLCFPLLLEIQEVEQAKKIIIPSGDANKNMETLASVWDYLSNNGATRKSLLINLGGGMLTDLGGFAAATFKRGIRFVNIPTTLLGAVDAAVGGKTGINFAGLKNEIGSFYPAEAVLIDTSFFKTLDRKNFLSGYAEMIKHALLKDVEEWKKVLLFDTNSINYDNLKDLIISSIAVKEKIVSEDPFEKNIRKALNLGHTIGHAFESFSHETKQPVYHGYAVAWGLICELYLSFKFCHFPKERLQQAVNFIKENYGIFYIDCKQYDRLFELMKHDKKNESDEINFTLLKNIGEIEINQIISQQDIYESLDFYRESLGI